MFCMDVGEPSMRQAHLCEHRLGMGTRCDIVGVVCGMLGSAIGNYPRFLPRAVLDEE